MNCASGSHNLPSEAFAFCISIVLTTLFKDGTRVKPFGIRICFVVAKFLILCAISTTRNSLYTKNLHPSGLKYRSSQVFPIFHTTPWPLLSPSLGSVAISCFQSTNEAPQASGKTIIVKTDPTIHYSPLGGNVLMNSPNWVLYEP